MEIEKNTFQKDLEELERLLGLTERTSVQNILKFEIEKYKGKIEQLEKVQKEAKEREEQAKKVTESDPSIIYEKLTKYAWDESDKRMTLYISLQKIGELDEDKITCDFSNQGFDLKIHGYNNKNYRFRLDNLKGALKTEKCKLKKKADKLVLSLLKAEKGKWGDLTAKKELIDKPQLDGVDKDPQAGLMSMIKNMYQNGDDDMKRTIAQAWTKSRDKQGGPGGAGGAGGLGGAPGMGGLGGLGGAGGMGGLGGLGGLGGAGGLGGLGGLGGGLGGLGAGLGGLGGLGGMGGKN